MRSATQPDIGEMISDASPRFLRNTWYVAAWAQEVVAGAIFSLVSITVFLKFWKPKNIFRFKAETEEEKQAHGYTPGQVLRAISHEELISVMRKYGR